MRVICDGLPPAVTQEMIRQAGDADADEDFRKLKEAVQQGRRTKESAHRQYTRESVWTELSVVDGLLCRGSRLVIPPGQRPGYSGSIREWLVEMAHDGHMGMDATKRMLRQRIWFPDMDRLVERTIGSCLACQASTGEYQQDPLRPNRMPADLWDTVYCDHWGPTREGDHLLVFIDALSRYPEVVRVQGTSAEDNIAAFNEVFARHGTPRVLRTDNGAPFNGTGSHLLRQYLRYRGVDHRPNISAEDPEASGQVEAFMKHIKKVFHTAEIMGKDPHHKLTDHLMAYRATPHPTTGKSPAELLFGRKFVINIPDRRTSMASGREDIQQARERDELRKDRMKEYRDSGRNVRPHNILQGDLIMLKRKTTKHRSMYEEPS